MSKEDADRPDFPTTLSDMQAAQRGDRRALEALLSHLRPWIQRIAAQRLGKPAGDAWDVEDIVQDTLKDLYQGLDQYHERPGETVRDWVARIVENNIRDLKRRGAAQKRGGGKQKLFRDAFPSSLSDPGQPAPAAGPSTEARANELDDLRTRARKALLARYREVLDLREQGLSFEDVAARLGLANVKVARNLHQRGMERLRELLEEFRPEDGRGTTGR